MGAATADIKWAALVRIGALCALTFVILMGLYFWYLGRDLGRASALSVDEQLMIVLATSMALVVYSVVFCVGVAYAYGRINPVSAHTIIHFVSGICLVVVFPGLIIYGRHNVDNIVAVYQDWGPSILLIIAGVGIAAIVRPLRGERYRELIKEISKRVRYIRYVLDVLSTVAFHREVLWDAWDPDFPKADIRTSIKLADQDSQQQERRKEIGRAKWRLLNFQTTCHTPEVEGEWIGESPCLEGAIKNSASTKRLAILDIGGAEGRLTATVLTRLLKRIGARGSDVELRAEMRGDILMLDPCEWETEYNESLKKSYAEAGFDDDKLTIRSVKQPFDKSEVTGKFDVILLCHSIYGILSQGPPFDGVGKKVADIINGLALHLTDHGVIFATIASENGASACLKKTISAALLGRFNLELTENELRNAGFKPEEETYFDTVLVMPQSTDSSVLTSHIVSWVEYFVRIPMDGVGVSVQRWVAERCLAAATKYRDLTEAEKRDLLKSAPLCSSIADTSVIRHKTFGIAYKKTSE